MDVHQVDISLVINLSVIHSCTSRKYGAGRYILVAPPKTASVLGAQISFGLILVILRLVFCFLFRSEVLKNVRENPANN